MLDFNTLEAKCRINNLNRLKDDYFLGSICGIWGKESKLWGSTVGFADLKKEKPILENSIFRIASMTKPILGCAFMQLYEKGLVELDAPVSNYIPEYSDMLVATQIVDFQITKSEKAKKQITPRMLLSHTSGLGSDEEVIRNYPYQKEDILGKSVANYARGILQFQPGTAECYSPLWAFDVCAHIIEIITQTPYEEYIQENILSPLNMVDTTYLPTDEQTSRVVDFATRTDKGLTLSYILPKSGFGRFSEGCVGGGAGLFSTIADYSKFAQMFLNKGKYHGKTILKPETVALMTTNQTITSLSGNTIETGWGLSMRVCRENNRLPKGSFGWSGAYGTHFWIDVKNEITCLYFMNLSNGGGAGEPASMEFEQDVMDSIVEAK